VEPWDTPFLRLVHRASDIQLVRRVLPKVDALATMIEHERVTYEAWLRNAPMIISELDTHFDRRQLRMRLGKIHYVGIVRPV
jgi:hypothetical protein